MKHLWFGIGLLAVLLLLGLWLGSALEPAYQPAAEDLEKALTYAREDNWPLAAALSLRARENWESRRNLTAALAHHGVPDQIDSLFIRLENCAISRDTAGFSTICAQLSQLLQSLHQSQRFTWWNLL